MKTHNKDSFASRFGEAEFKLRGVRQTVEDGKEEVIPDIYETCSYCGSFTIADTIKFFQTPGVEYSGADWKYGWPHKFYINRIPCEPYSRVVSSTWQNGKQTDIKRETSNHRWGKFYSEHMIDATPEQLEQWNTIVTPKLGVSFSIKDDKLYWSAPNTDGFYGYQANGVI